VTSLLTGDQLIPSLPHPTGSEWLEALISTGKQYAVPRLTAGADLWDGTITIKSLSLAMLRHARLLVVAACVTPAQRLAVWSDPGLGELRAVMR
jgi:hypothetical protein